MRYFLIYNKENKVCGHLTSENLPSLDEPYKEVNQKEFKSILNSVGVNFKTTEDLIEDLETETAEILLDSVIKGIRIEQNELDIADLLLVMGGM